MTGSLRACLAEALGTFALVLFGAGAILTGKAGLLGVAFAFGLTIMALAWTFGKVSGGHFNPAVTGAMLVTGRVSAPKALLYVAAQLIGSVLGAFVLAQIYKGSPDILVNAPYLGSCVLDGVSVRSGAFIEAVLTFFLVLVVFATSVDPRAAGVPAPLAIGLTVTLGVLWAGPLTGASINPARAFGPAVVSGYWANHLVYWIGPLVGGMVAALVYEHLFLTKE